jgi:hypothetical protein
VKKTEQDIADDLKPMVLIAMGIMLGLGAVGGFTIALAVLR